MGSFINVIVVDPVDLVDLLVDLVDKENTSGNRPLHESCSVHFVH